MLLNMKEKNCSQRGLSLIEAAMVLALSAVVVAGAVMYYGTASDGSKLQRTQSQIGAIQSAVASLYANQASYAGLTASMLRDSRALPATYFTASGSIVSPWAKPVVLATVQDNSAYTLTYDQVPASACVKLLTSELGTGVEKFELGIGAADVNVVALPVTLAEAKDLCGSTTVKLVYTLI
ncbi:hypothetical protein J9978_21695 [Chromobacterium violaceum]|uniref:type 4 pilus major pilin n=1 Tax=Chromobacterium violaceum TaxID=536 RepID=UPI0009DB5137|nr:type 4 pilus major pilin [Chromobacterium violaceum]MBP4052091.1 hypothetical protein [Chromobacterium violaceum]OQS20458.1 hypothetical protein B0T41_21695 [Chromobacterium violaceum]